MLNGLATYPRDTCNPLYMGCCNPRKFDFYRFSRNTGHIQRTPDSPGTLELKKGRSALLIYFGEILCDVLKHLRIEAKTLRGFVC